MPRRQRSRSNTYSPSPDRRRRKNITTEAVKQIFRLIVPSNKAGMVIGKGGETIKQVSMIN